MGRGMCICHEAVNCAICHFVSLISCSFPMHSHTKPGPSCREWAFMFCTYCHKLGCFYHFKVRFGFHKMYRTSSKKSAKYGFTLFGGTLFMQMFQAIGKTGIFMTLVSHKI